MKNRLAALCVRLNSEQLRISNILLHKLGKSSYNKDNIVHIMHEYNNLNHDHRLSRWFALTL